VITPGIMNKISVLMMQFSPTFLTLKITALLNKPKK